ncbi:hypothetical protein GCM10008967_21290 [Bacillus carboniphilus]|uniref:Uncharacterized protein n=1 Tax=Bacillus carboniphilus TaxID=86663 RepID=A0ABN0WA46_9BACI
MIKKFLMPMIMGFCLVFVQLSGTFASSEKILQKQSKVDQFLFEDHAAELEEQGMFVTHTSPEENHVEIGISPYTEEHANYLYEVLGEEDIKVVEGQQATTLLTGAETTSTEIAAGEDVATTENNGMLGIIGSLALLALIITFVFIKRKKHQS